MNTNPTEDMKMSTTRTAIEAALKTLALTTIEIEPDDLEPNESVLSEAIPQPLAQQLCSLLTEQDIDATWTPDSEDRELSWVYVREPSLPDGDDEPLAPEHASSDYETITTEENDAIEARAQLRSARAHAAGVTRLGHDDRHAMPVADAERRLAEAENPLGLLSGSKHERDYLSQLVDDFDQRVADAGPLTRAATNEVRNAILAIYQRSIALAR